MPWTGFNLIRATLIFARVLLSCVRSLLNRIGGSESLGGTYGWLLASLVPAVVGRSTARAGPRARAYLGVGRAATR